MLALSGLGFSIRVLVPLPRRLGWMQLAEAKMSNSSNSGWKMLADLVGGCACAMRNSSNPKVALARLVPPVTIPPSKAWSRPTPVGGSCLEFPDSWTPRGGKCVYLFIFKKTGNFCLLLFVFIWNKIRHFCLTNCNYVLLWGYERWRPCFLWECSVYLPCVFKHCFYGHFDY